MHLMFSMFDSGEEFPHLPFVGLLLPCGSSLRSSYFILHILCGRSHSLYSSFGIYDCFVVEVNHLGSTLIVGTSIGEIVLLDRVCRGCELETAARKLVDDSYYQYYI